MPFKDPAARKEYQQRYAREHADEAKERSRRWHAAHPGRPRKSGDRSAYHAEYYRQNREQAIERARAWKAAHPEAARASEVAGRERNRQQIRDSSAAWRRRNLAVRAEYERRRRARIRGNPYEKIDPFAVAERDGWICHLCDLHVDLADLSLDHVIPVSQDGPHLYGNVRLAHTICNIRRGVKPVATYRALLLKVA